MFFLLFLLSPFAFLGFYTVDYLYSCILHIPQHRTQFPFCLASYSHSGPLAFRPLRPAHSGATLQHPLPPPHLLRTRLAPFAHPYTCQHRRCFCLFRARPAQCERISAKIHKTRSPVGFHTSKIIAVYWLQVVFDAPKI